jgi:hypothetical protein
VSCNSSRTNLILTLFFFYGWVGFVSTLENFTSTPIGPKKVTQVSDTKRAPSGTPISCQHCGRPNIGTLTPAPIDGGLLKSADTQCHVGLGMWAHWQGHIGGQCSLWPREWPSGC